MLDRYDNLNQSEVIEKLTQINYILNKGCKKTTDILWEIRAYLVECKEDKSEVDIDKLLKMLD